MTEAECVRFLQTTLPELRLRWAGFRKVRRTVCKRVTRRFAALGLPDVAAYRRFLDDHPDERIELDAMCRIGISRFGRDRGLWRRLVDDVLPRLAAERRPVRAWSAGCCGGEEPYTLAIAWSLEVAPRHPGVRLDILATDVDPVQLERARAGCYAPGSVRELPPAWRDEAFEARGDRLCVRPAFRQHVRFAVHDLRSAPPAGPFDLILCRNVAFTYFDDQLQRAVADALRAALAPDGVLVVGAHERLPDDTAGWRACGRAVFVTSTSPRGRAARGADPAR